MEAISMAGLSSGNACFALVESKKTLSNCSIAVFYGF
jgi:hypothetical protein